MNNIGFTCNVCGRTVQGCTIVNGMYFCAKCYQETFGEKVNQCNHCSFKSVNDMLAEKIGNLEQQLAEKDKEINKLSKEHFEMFGDMKDYKNLWLAEQRKNKEIRKQVCDEIRAFFDVNPEVVDFDYLNEILNQIEQAREDLK